MTVQSILSSISDTVHRLQNEHTNEGNTLMVAAVATLVLLGVGWLCIQTISQANEQEENRANSKNGGDTTVTKCISSGPITPKTNEEGALRNVFSVKQRPLVTGGLSSKASTERPFGSSYYYAHNNPSSKGVYADGLRAEDYVMNGPKLLSKGGVRVEEPSVKTVDQDESSSIISDQNDAKPKMAPASKQITRYLWDDDGGVTAKIHIDSLPLSSTETMSWQDASVSKENVQVRLTGECNDGLMVSITSQNQKKYHLHVPKMYGSADLVKAIVKKHKLLIKITKRKIPKRQSAGSGEGLWGLVSGAVNQLFGGDTKDSYISVKWPQLSATGGDIDEKMFKEVDFRDE
jgi:hypothetical protein